MRTAYTEFGKLKEIIVGRELNFSKRLADISFKHFYGTNMSHNQFSHFEDYKINSEYISERNEDLDNLAKTFESLGAIVRRPDPVDKLYKIKTPDFESFLSSPSNVRDTTLIYGDTIIETPPLVRGKIFEHYSLHNLFKEYMLDGSKWLKSPIPFMTDEMSDRDPWYEPRDWDVDYMKYDIGIDAAQYLKMGNELFCNISSYNHKLGAKWIETILPDVKVHYFDSMIDNHIDSTLLPLRPGVFLVNEAGMKRSVKDYLPEKYKNWDLIKIEGNGLIEKNFDDIYPSYVQLCSIRGMNVNIVSVDENTIVVNEDADVVIRELEKRKFDVVPVKLRHCELFGGSVHCSTLDVDREDEKIDYTS